MALECNRQSLGFRVQGFDIRGCGYKTRLLHQQGRPPLRAAYVEAVATEPGRERNGYASAAMRVLAGQVWEYELAALSPSDEDFYARLGWESWRGERLTATGKGGTPESFHRRR